jgi:hypothetical protein
MLADLAGSMAAKIEQLVGLARAAELQPDVLFERMLAEAQESRRVVVGTFPFGAWARVRRSRQRALPNNESRARVVISVIVDVWL